MQSMTSDKATVKGGWRIMVGAEYLWTWGPDGSPVLGDAEYAATWPVDDRAAAEAKAAEFGGVVVGTGPDGGPAGSSKKRVTYADGRWFPTPGDRVWRFDAATGQVIKGTVERSAGKGTRVLLDMAPGALRRRSAPLTISWQVGEAPIGVSRPEEAPEPAATPRTIRARRLMRARKAARALRAKGCLGPRLYTEICRRDGDEYRIFAGVRRVLGAIRDRRYQEHKSAARRERHALATRAIELVAAGGRLVTPTMTRAYAHDARNEMRIDANGSLLVRHGRKGDWLCLDGPGLEYGVRRMEAEATTGPAPAPPIGISRPAAPEAPSVPQDASPTPMDLSPAPIVCGAPSGLSVALALPPAMPTADPIDWPSYQITVHGPTNLSQIDTATVPIETAKIEEGSHPIERRRWLSLPAPRPMLALTFQPAPAPACCPPTEAAPCTACAAAHPSPVLPDATPSPRISRTAPALVITIKGESYALTVLDLGRSYMVEGTRGAYRVDASDEHASGAVCDCKDFDRRHRGLDTAGCKHIKAIVDAVLIAPARIEEPAPMDRNTLPSQARSDRTTDPDFSALPALAPICGGSTDEAPKGRRRKPEDARDRLRKLQDRIVAEAERRGFPEHVAVSVNLPTRITIESLRHFIEPDYEAELRQVLADIGR